MKRIAMIIDLAGREVIRSEGTIFAINSKVKRPDAKNHISSTIHVTTMTCVPVPKDIVVTRRTLACEQSIAQAVQYISESDLRINEKDAVPAKLVDALHSQVRGECDVL